MQRDDLLSAEEKEHICEACAKSLRVMRTYLGWKQRELALAVGTTYRRISEIETGKAKLSWTLYMALAFVFSINHNTRNSPVYDTVVPKKMVRFLFE